MLQFLCRKVNEINRKSGFPNRKVAYRKPGLKVPVGMEEQGGGGGQLI